MEKRTITKQTGVVHRKAKRVKLSWKICTALTAFAALVIFVLIICFTRDNIKSFILPVDADKIIWCTDNSVAENDEVEIPVRWRELNVSAGLLSALLASQEKDYLAIYVRSDENELNNFIYGEKKYQDYYLELDELNTLSIKLESLKKDGEILKYGERVYIEGVPSGDKWSKELYEQTISYYGAKLLNLYIVDGEFLHSKVEDDMIETKNKQQNLYHTLETIRNEFNEQNANIMYEHFKKSDYSVTVVGTVMYLFITKEDFANLNINNVNRYVFYHASYKDYANSGALPD